MRPFAASILAAVSLVAPLSAAPMALKEIEFHVRQRTPEADIAREASQRQLLVPLDAAAIAALRKTGASDALIDRLKQPGMVVDPAARMSELARQEAHAAKLRAGQADGATLLEAREKQRAAIAAQRLNAGAARALFDGKLVKLAGDDLKPYAASELANVRIFAIYYSGLWCAPCRRFTPQLVAAYHEIKAKHPEFELIFVSRDNDEFNMLSYMRDYKMPWPAVRFGASDAGIEQFAGKGIPWLVAISDSAQPLTTNGADKKYVAPERVLQGIAYLLQQMDPKR